MSDAAHTEMWEKLNLDISAHDGLLEVLGKFYGDIYLSQENRLKGMEYLDFVLSEVHGLRIKELQDAKAAGKKIIGTFCVFVPEELTLAANAVHVGLCSGADAGTDEAEKLVPRNTCALIKSFIGFKLARLCPFTESCDLVVGETTCDGKKKAYEAFGKLVPMHVMEVPQTKTMDAKQLFKSEVLRYKDTLEELTGVEITAENLQKAISIVNEKRRALQRLSRLRAADPAPISGRDALLINQVSFYDDPERFTQSINTLCDQIEERIAQGDGVVPAGTKRLLLSGCPMAVPNWKLPYVMESSNAVIVGEESCIGSRNTRDLVDESADTIEGMIDALVERYMKIDCACFTPNDERMVNVANMVNELNADGVIHYALSFCQPYAHEAIKMQEVLSEKDIPMLSVETGYSMEDVEQLKTRVEAFVEMLD
ncbi:double-cubane-cluster-containing anaerobic reductase [Halodesulfovibrio marinisediminis]|uniref:Benzoyl-CoA reductase/2-hydroxyglutaryl-CoA dehydratase subunit, BcrC/BadD/HgdB n=1 Tax=Halodesulfovibrio marinisediminis DSM 17456 TaxID=1121457 RepID=A0A1N6DUW8_9BACT|nr:double-cubane-cluster-containing anaerobic reductase [Halodesulfovibrio marinisediminis]SIN74507.1 Benzoyl-CoA reductase/2-hydroxyglutaryl-CoA dehydratase subunit, BcrC/BadD/HgdB [Halodesulfovibrio marinisediminis DSM 17456]